MKKVSLILGAAGLAPMAGVMIPTPVMASSTRPQTTNINTKTVSLDAVMAPAATGCTGTVYAFASNNFQSWERFWYTKHATKTCIGTVQADDPQGAPFATYWRIRIWHGQTLEYSHKVNVTPTSLYLNHGVHQSFPNSPKVCTRLFSTYSNGSGSPICRTVP